MLSHENTKTRNDEELATETRSRRATVVEWCRRERCADAAKRRMRVGSTLKRKTNSFTTFCVSAPIGRHVRPAQQAGGAALAPPWLHVLYVDSTA